MQWRPTQQRTDSSWPFPPKRKLAPQLPTLWPRTELNRCVKCLFVSECWCHWLAKLSLFLSFQSIFGGEAVIALLAIHPCIGDDSSSILSYDTHRISKKVSSRRSTSFLGKKPTICILIFERKKVIYISFPFPKSFSYRAHMYYTLSVFWLSLSVICKFYGYLYHKFHQITKQSCYWINQSCRMILFQMIILLVDTTTIHSERSSFNQKCYK